MNLAAAAGIGVGFSSGGFDGADLLFSPDMGGLSTAVSIIPWWLALSAVLFSTLIGVGAGYYPARRAVNIPALEAIKHD